MEAAARGGAACLAPARVVAAKLRQWQVGDEGVKFCCGVRGERRLQPALVFGHVEVALREGGAELSCRRLPFAVACADG